MIEHNRHQLAAEINAERRRIKARFTVSTGLAAFASGMTAEAAILAAGELLGYWESGPVFLTGTVPGLALAALSLWLSLATARKSGYLQAKRQAFWDAYGYEPGEIE